MKTSRIFQFFFLLSLLFLFNCKEKDDQTDQPDIKVELATLTTHDGTEVTTSSAKSGGNIADDGNANISARGVCWNTSINPTITNNKTTDGSGTGNFVSSLTGLEHSTTYYIRAYATNSAGTAYGNQVSITTETPDPVLATLTTTEVNVTTSTTAESGGDISNNGYTTVTARGVCWSTTEGPTTDDSKTEDGSGEGAFTSSISGLTPNTTYYIRAYAVNSVGTAYGDQLSFTTPPPEPVLATITTADISDITAVSATSGGDITNEGNATISDRGVCWSTSENPTTSDNLTSDGSGGGVFSSTITGLITNTTYYVRAYAVNSAGTAYGNQLSFTTLCIEPTALTGDASGIGTSGATLSGEANANGNETSLSFEYGTTLDYGNTATASPSTITGEIAASANASISGLTPNTTYNYRLRAENCGGITYGNNKTFTTGCVEPDASTSSASSVSHSAATFNASVNANYASTEVTFEYGTSTSYGNTIAATQSPVSGSSSISVSASPGGLTPNTTYHFRVIAENCGGTATGEDMTFTTDPPPVELPVLTTNGVSGITVSSAVSGGNISFDGNATISARGVCWVSGTGTPTIANNKTTDGTGTGSFTSSITGLSPNTTYSVRAYASNSSGTAYGNKLTFTTACAAPTASTSEATGVGSSSAMLNGYVNAKNATTTVNFDYGTSTSYSSFKAASPSTVSGSSTTSVNCAISDLAPNTTYHYRIRTINCGGTTLGSDMTFTTGCVAATATTSSATSISSSGATMRATVNANNSTTSVSFQYGTSTSYGSTKTASPSSVSGSSATSVNGTLSGLQPNTTYYYRVRAENCGGVTYGSNMSFTTSAVKPTVTTLSAQSITSSSASLRGQVNANNSTTSASFQWGSTSSYGNTKTASPSSVSGNSATNVSGTITGLNPNTTYNYRVSASNSAGTSNGSNASFTTACAKATATTNSATSVNPTSATLRATINPKYASTTVYFDYGRTTSLGSTVSVSTYSGSSNISISKTISGLDQGTKYYYRVRTVNCGGTTYGSIYYFDTGCNAPTVSTLNPGDYGPTEGRAKLYATVDANGAPATVSFEWGTSTSYGHTVSGGSTSSTNAVTMTGYITSGLTEGTIYYYRVKATGCGGTVYGSSKSFIVDHQSNAYTIRYFPTRIIGMQIVMGAGYWMTRNLKTNEYQGGGQGGDTSMVLPLVQYLRYSNSTINEGKYGLMYSGTTVGSSYNICPTGWAVPTDAEWNSLINYLGGTSVAGRAKSTGTLYWNSPNTGAENSFGMDMRGGGYYTTNFYSLKYTGRWWTSTSYKYKQMRYNNDDVTTGTGASTHYYYIRCKKQ